MRRGGWCLAVCRWAGLQLRALMDAFESRLAASALLAAFACYGLSLASYLMSWPAESPAGEMVVTAGAQLFGNWMLLIGVVAYGRFVVLDVQGLVARERRPVRRRKVKASEKEGMGTKSALAGRATTAASRARALWPGRPARSALFGRI